MKLLTKTITIEMKVVFKGDDHIPENGLDYSVYSMCEDFKRHYASNSEDGDRVLTCVGYTSNRGGKGKVSYRSEDDIESGYDFENELEEI
jgi:hypothetical protein